MIGWKTEKSLAKPYFLPLISTLTLYKYARKSRQKRTDLDFGQFFAAPGLFRVIEPASPHDHVATPCLPQRLNAPHVRQIWSTGWEEHGAISYLQQRKDKKNFNFSWILISTVIHVSDKFCIQWITLHMSLFSRRYLQFARYGFLENLVILLFCSCMLGL